MSMKQWGARGWHSLIAMLGAMAASLAPAPALAHGVLWDGDPAHLMEDLAVSFGIPLVVLIVGALAGIGLAQWMSRGQQDRELDEVGDAESEEAAVQQRD
jgi:hypothetical protein